jgi:hypothetical protein
VVGSTSAIILLFGFQTFKLVRDNSIGRKRSPDASNIESTSPPHQTLNINSPGSGGGNLTVGGVSVNRNNNSLDPERIVAVRTLLLVLIYFGSFFGILLLAPLNAARVNAPIGLEIVAGWMVKVILILFALSCCSSLIGLRGFVMDWFR